MDVMAKGLLAEVLVCEPETVFEWWSGRTCPLHVNWVAEGETVFVGEEEEEAAEVTEAVPTEM